MDEAENQIAHVADDDGQPVRGPAGRTAHTPGPWENNMQLPPSRSEHGSRCVSYIIGRRTNVADVCDSADISEAEARANASLIAAAPELLAACRLFAAYQAAIDSDDPASRPLEAYSTAMDAAYAAIAKAEGQA